MVSPSLLTLPTRSTSSARVARMRLRAVGVGKVRSSAAKNAWVWNGGAVYVAGIGGFDRAGGPEIPVGGLGGGVSSTMLRAGPGGGGGGDVSEEPWPERGSFGWARVNVLVPEAETLV